MVGCGGCTAIVAAILIMAEENGMSGVVLLVSAAKSPVVTDGQRPWIRDLEPYSSNRRN